MLFTHIFFDCDSTLTRIEGIDALAELRAVAEAIGIPRERVYAEVLDKVTTLRQVLPAGARSVFVGDGSTDAATRGIVDRFIGFGGVVPREYVRQNSDVYITEPSLTAVLPHIL